MSVESHYQSVLAIVRAANISASLPNDGTGYIFTSYPDISQSDLGEATNEIAANILCAMYPEGSTADIATNVAFIKDNCLRPSAYNMLTGFAAGENKVAAYLAKLGAAPYSIDPDKGWSKPYLSLVGKLRFEAIPFFAMPWGDVSFQKAIDSLTIDFAAASKQILTNGSPSTIDIANWNKTPSPQNGFQKTDSAPTGDTTLMPSFCAYNENAGSFNANVAGMSARWAMIYKIIHPGFGTGEIPAWGLIPWGKIDWSKVAHSDDIVNQTKALGGLFAHRPFPGDNGGVTTITLTPGGGGNAVPPGLIDLTAPPAGGLTNSALTQRAICTLSLTQIRKNDATIQGYAGASFDSLKSASANILQQATAGCASGANISTFLTHSNALLQTAIAQSGQAAPPIPNGPSTPTAATPMSSTESTVLAGAAGGLAGAILGSLVTKNKMEGAAIGGVVGIAAGIGAKMLMKDGAGNSLCDTSNTTALRAKSEPPCSSPKVRSKWALLMRAARAHRA